MPTMESIIGVAVNYLTQALDAIALLMIAVGAVKALADIAVASMQGRMADARVRTIFIGFARWLVAALTFQLGSDIAATTLDPGWDELGRLGAVAVIRTFLTFFLDRDLDKARDEQQAQGERKQALHGVP
jgi:uncharacterized membrane protein